MYKYGKSSKARLETCHADLLVIADQIIKHRDATVICGHRSEEEQNALFNAKPPATKVKYPDSKHNSYPSNAIDFAPYPLDWNDTASFRYFAGYVMATADILFEAGIIEHKLRWGGDWDMDNDLKDNKFNDLVHFELYKPEA